MATGQSFVLTGGTGNILVGGSTVASPVMIGMQSTSAQGACNAAGPTGSGVQTTTNVSATPVGRIMFDPAMSTIPPGIGADILAFGQFVGGFAKNGAVGITFTGTTPVSLDLTNIAAAVGVTSTQAGDTAFATTNAITFQNTSASGTITIAPGASNPSSLPKFTGTTPTLSVDFGGCICVYDPSGQTVDSTHKIITLTPSAAGSMNIYVGGA